MANSASLEEIDRRIQIVEDNLRELIEQAAAFSGAADEERTSQRIADLGGGATFYDCLVQVERSD